MLTYIDIDVMFVVFHYHCEFSEGGKYSEVVIRWRWIDRGPIPKWGYSTEDFQNKPFTVTSNYSVIYM